MKKASRLITVLLVYIAGCSLPLAAQQKSIPQLIVTSMNEASAGFPSLMKDTVADIVFGWRLKNEVVNQYANVKKATFLFEKNQHSVFYKDSLFTINTMTVRSPDIVFAKDKKWTDYKDTLNSYFKQTVDFYTKAFGKQLNYTQVLVLENEKEADYKPLLLVYFYSKAISIEEGITDMYEVQRALDISAWFTVELKKGRAFIDGQFRDVCYMQYRVHGGQLQIK